MKTWHIVTPEYPPDCGGVGDYTAVLEAGLVAGGDRVRVWHPGNLPDRFGRQTRRTLAAAMAADPGILLIQYVPAAFGLGGLNLPFSWWIARLPRRGVDVRVMFHEPFFYFGLHRPWRNGLALVQRAMAALLLHGATRVYYSTETWRRLLAPFGGRADAEILPIPATIPACAAAPSAASRTAPFVAGHFGSYGEHVAGELARVLPALLSRLPQARVMLAGRGAGAFAATLSAADRTRVDVLGSASADTIAGALRGCDLLIQPYPDGVTTRRTSMMAALTTGVPVVTTAGALTEPVWLQARGVALAPAGDPSALVDLAVALAADPLRRHAIGVRGRQLYDEQFALSVTLSRMQRA